MVNFAAKSKNILLGMSKINMLLDLEIFWALAVHTSD
jgi:hypothetical protein